MEGRDLAAYRRIIKAGYKPRAIRARIRQIGEERNWPQRLLDRALRLAKTDHDHLLDFALKHLPGVSLEWLFFAHIRGLRRVGDE